MSHWRHLFTSLTVEEVIARSIVNEKGCWIWQGAFSAQGYAIYGKNGHVRVARFMWERKAGREMPDSLQACHRCDDTRCVNPDCIYAGTSADNMKDAWQRSRKAPRRVVQTLSDIEVEEIKTLLKNTKESRRSMARAYNVSHATINKTANGERFKDILLLNPIEEKT